eukprot:gene1213-11303_t
MIKNTIKLGVKKVKEAQNNMTMMDRIMFYGLLSPVLTISVISGSYDSLYYGYKSKYFIETEGIILDEKNNSNESVPLVKYTVEDKDYFVQHTSYKYFGFSKNQIEKLNLLQKYKKNEKTKIYFDENNPKRSILEKGIGMKGIESLCLPISMLTLPIPKYGIVISSLSFISFFTIGSILSYKQFKDNIYQK